MKQILYQNDEYSIVYDYEECWFYFVYKDGNIDPLAVARPGFFDLENDEFDAISDFIKDLLVRAYDKE